MPAEGFHHPKATPRAPSQPPGARTPLAELVAVHDQSILVDASNGGLLDEVSPKVPVELPVFPVAVFRGELPEPPQELVMQHQGSGLQLVNTNSQLGAGVDELAGLQERQENPGGVRVVVLVATWGYLRLNNQRWPGFIHFTVSNWKSPNWKSPNWKSNWESSG